MILWAWWFLYPFIQSFVRSFQDANFAALDQAKFIGLENYVTILQDKEFFRALLHSLEIVVISIPIQTLLGLLLAILVNQKLKGKGYSGPCSSFRILPRRSRSRPCS